MVTIVDLGIYSNYGNYCRFIVTMVTIVDL